MGEQSLQVSRAVLGFSRAPLGWRGVAVVGLVIAAVVSLAPGWWGHAVVSAARWVGQFWPAVVLVLLAVSLVVGDRRRTVPTTLGRRPRASRMPLAAHVALLLGLAVVVAGAAGMFLWVVLGRPMAGGAPAAPEWGIQDRLAAMKVVLAVVGGVGAVVALTVAYRRQRLNEVDAYREDAKVMLDRFGKAAELLGAPDAAVRTAGVYALAALANDAPEARQGCVDVLCAYLRQPYLPPSDGAGGNGAAHDPAQSPRGMADSAHTGRDPRQERQVRLTIIRLIRDNLHLPDDDPRTWRGHDFNFTGAVFDGGDFTGATFTGAGTVNFDDTTITGPLRFADATFASGIVSFDGAQFVGGGISLSKARFDGGVVDLSRIDAAQRPAMSELWPTGTPVPPGLRLPPLPSCADDDGGVRT